MMKSFFLSALLQPSQFQMSIQDSKFHDETPHLELSLYTDQFQIDNLVLKYIPVQD